MGSGTHGGISLRAYVLIPFSSPVALFTHGVLRTSVCTQKRPLTGSGAATPFILQTCCHPCNTKTLHAHATAFTDPSPSQELRDAIKFGTHQQTAASTRYWRL